MRPVLVSACIGMMFVSVASADDPVPPQPQAITKGIWLIPGGITPNRQPDGNTVIFQAPQGLIVMDTGRHPWHRAAIENFAKSRHRNIVAIINSHWHLDHLSGNPALRRDYPHLHVYASNAIDGALKGFLPRSAADSRQYLEPGKLPPEEADDLRRDMATIEAGDQLRPDIVITRSENRTIAGRNLEVNLAANAATDGDVWVFDKSSGVVAAGDLVTLPAAFLDTACPAGWSAALKTIADQPFKTLIPGHGTPMTPKQFSTYRTAFDALIDCAASPKDKAECAANWANDVKGLIGDNDRDFKMAEGMTAYYVSDVLRAHGDKSAECKI